MLPNHAPLVIAEQFGTLEAMFPGRIDLGIGRASGADRAAMYALHRESGKDFSGLLHELQGFLGESIPTRPVNAVPGQNSHVPITLLGSSDYSAELAGYMGLPFAFAAHFAPEYLSMALGLYRDTFEPGKQLSKPYPMVAIQIIVAPTDEEAEFLLTTPQQRFLALIRNQPVELKPPVDSMDGLWNPAEEQAVKSRLSRAIVGSPATVARKLADFAAFTGAREILAVTDTYDQSHRLRSLEMLAEIAGVPELTVLRTQ